MKTIRRRSGVELLEICGEYLLVSTKEARGVCPYVTQINEAAAVCWKLLDQPFSVNELIEHTAVFCGKEKKDVFLPVLAFVNRLGQKNYLIEEDTE